MLETDLLGPYILADMQAKAAVTGRAEFDASSALESQSERYKSALSLIPYVMSGHDAEKSALQKERELAAEKYKKYLLKADHNE